jgi:UDP-N-acetylglucosamine diphosphorylase/glucosamine-1-phosphate N-acetyltransferase
VRLAVYEDHAAAGFGPIAALRPIFELMCGAFTVRARLTEALPVTEWGAFLRPELVETYREEHPTSAINDFAWLQQGTTLLVNGRWLPTRNALQGISEEDVGLVDNTVVYLTLDSLEATLLQDLPWEDALAQIARTRTFKNVPGKLVRYPWDLVSHNSLQLQDDFTPPRGRSACNDLGTQVSVLGSPSLVQVSPSATVEPFGGLDVRRGPIWIDDGVVIEAHSRIAGPCFISRGSQLLGATIRQGTTIGPACKIGGEVQQSIIHGYANKCHEGFLGHSYVCPWVNLGANTTNSDLKNDYSTVCVPLAGEMMDSGLQKVGCFIGDHTKTAIGSLFNTGSSVGVMSMVVPGGRLLPKHIPAFSFVRHGDLDCTWDLEAGLDAARAAMTRRHVSMPAAQERLLRRHFASTQDERELAFRFQRERNEKNASAALPSTSDR